MCPENVRQATKRTRALPLLVRFARYGVTDFRATFRAAYRHTRASFSASMPRTPLTNPTIA